MAIDIDKIQRRAQDLGIGARVAAKLSESEFDAIIALSADNVQYLSGRWWPVLRTRLAHPNVVVWPRTSEPILVFGSEQAPGYKRDSWIEIMRTFEGRGRSSLSALVGTLADTLREFGLHKKRVGIETHYMPVEFHRLLSELLPDATFVPCDGFLDGLRMIKTSGEIALIAEAARASDRGTREALEATRAGWTEKRLAKELTVRILGNGLDMVTNILIGAGEGARAWNMPTQHVLALGEMVRIDLNSVLGGYYADLGRMAFVGEAPAAYRRAYKGQLELNRAIHAMIKPGVRAFEVFDFCQQTAKRLGLRLVDVPWIGLGHGTGINPSEYPKLNQGDDTAIAPGMILNVEADIFGPADEVIHVEDMLLVTEDGCRVLTNGANWDELVEIQV